ncbi:DUF1054 domain-containing protein [Halolactibacillus miurensis]|uniref:UPF0637 protein SAMN05421668_105155 n=2 Tax=Halolactibacillus miurensis TaxID=306541 RepID=A0A1I6R5L7_9BACI|nr:DUF1054 domain-containing protein [Halolactibacillus miurensis]SFS59983.1 Uncharacterized protein YktB, UPF0637 family [Halolactibacillus miurensis]
MTSTTFTQEDFEIFTIDGLTPRMAALKNTLQPKLRTIGDRIKNQLQEHLDTPLYLHVAKHQRRTVNPPIDSWFALSTNKRGYKKHPHFEVGLFNDRLFIYFALMHNVPDKAKLAQHLIDYQSVFDALDSSYVYALDHYDKEAYSLDTLNNQALAYFRKTKKADFLIGKQLTKQETIRMTSSDFDRFVLDTFTALLPLYFETTLAQMK